MNKKISIIAITLVAIAGAYWYSAMNSSGYGIDNKAPETLETSSPNISVVSKGPLGIASGLGSPYLVDRNGLTLYVNAKDAAQTGTAIKASCDAECEKFWLPYFMEANDPGISQTTDPLLSKLNVINRADGSQQYSLGNQPLYRSANDAKLGDKNGNVGADWMVAIP